MTTTKTKLRLLRKIQKLKNRLKDIERGYFKAGEAAEWGGCAYWDEEKKDAEYLLQQTREQLKTLR